MTIKAIVWDLDGTLIHFKIDYLRARKETLKILKQNGVPKRLITIQDSILDNVAKAKTFFHSINLPQKKIQEIMDEINERVIVVEYDAAIQASPLQGIDEVLTFIKNRSLQQAIYTLNTKKNAEIFLKRAGLLQYFKIIAGRDSVQNPKPHPDHLIFICNELAIDTDEIIVIGDTHRDIEGALNVGAPSIALLTKISDRQRLQNANCIIEERDVPQKLIEALNSLLK